MPPILMAAVLEGALLPQPARQASIIAAAMMIAKTFLFIFLFSFEKKFFSFSRQAVGRSVLPAFIQRSGPAIERGRFAVSANVMPNSQAFWDWIP